MITIRMVQGRLGRKRKREKGGILNLVLKHYHLSLCTCCEISRASMLHSTISVTCSAPPLVPVMSVLLSYLKFPKCSIVLFACPPFLPPCKQLLYTLYVPLFKVLERQQQKTAANTKKHVSDLIDLTI